MAPRTVKLVPKYSKPHEPTSPAATQARLHEEIAPCAHRTPRTTHDTAFYHQIPGPSRRSNDTHISNEIRWFAEVAHDSGLMKPRTHCATYAIRYRDPLSGVTHGYTVPHIRHTLSVHCDPTLPTDTGHPDLQFCTLGFRCLSLNIWQGSCTPQINIGVEVRRVTPHALLAWWAGGSAVRRDADDCHVPSRATTSPQHPVYNHPHNIPLREAHPWALPSKHRSKPYGVVPTLSSRANSVANWNCEQALDFRIIRSGRTYGLRGAS